MLDNSKFFAFFMIVTDALLCLFFASIFWLIAGKGNFWNSFKMVYLLFGAPSIPMAVLCIAFEKRDDLKDMFFGLGAGFYYGGILCSIIITKIYGLPTSHFTIEIGFVLSALVCWIVGLYRTKRK